MSEGFQIITQAGLWNLYTREVSLGSKPPVRIYFFSMREPKVGDICDLPKEYMVGITARRGMPYVRRKPPEEEIKREPKSIMKDVIRKPESVETSIIVMRTLLEGVGMDEDKAHYFIQHLIYLIKHNKF
jgi:hypothetical protein